MASTRALFTLVVAGSLAMMGIAGVAGPAVAQETELVTLTVTVVDDEGESLGNVGLEATWSADGGGSVAETTRANGQVLLDVPRGADVTITIDDEAYVRNEPFVHEDASTGPVNVTVREAGTATVEVVDAEGAVADAQVRLWRAGTTVVRNRTSAEGTHTSTLIEQGQYHLTVRKSGYLTNRTTVTVDGNVTERVTLSQASRLVTFHVTDDHFDRPRSLTAVAITVGGNMVTTLSNGEATIRLPVNTDYELEVTKAGYETITPSLSVDEADLQRNVSIQRLDAISVTPEQSQVVVGQSVRVTVTDEYGEPVPNATLSIGGETVGETDAEGEATVSIESGGSVEIAATSGDLAANASVQGVAADGETLTGTGDGSGGAQGTDQTTTEPTSITGPGFTTLGTLVAGILAVALLARRD